VHIQSDFMHEVQGSSFIQRITTVKQLECN
jgi:hypothetical protein